MSLIIVSHEFGHLITAKLFGVYCYEFSLGMGPKLFSKKGKETEYSVRAFPLGGFVRMAGEDDAANPVIVDENGEEKAAETEIEIPEDRKLTGVAPWKRLIIMLAGIFMNLVLGVALFSIMYGIMGDYVDYPDPVIVTVQENGPADLAGFMPNDRILSVTYANGITIKPETFYEVSTYMQAYPGESVYKVERDGKVFDITITPEYDNEYGRYMLGVTMGEYKVYEVNWANAPYYGLKYSKFMMKEVFMTLGNLIQGKGLQNLSGPVGIYEATDEAMSSATSIYEGFMYFINIWAVLSLNVGAFNLLPIPMMDGGRALMTLFEIVTGRPISKKVENFLMLASLALIGLLFAYVMFNDITKLLF